MTDDIDRILEQWHHERPDLDVLPMGVVGRLSRASAAVDARLAQTFAEHGLEPEVRESRSIGFMQ